MYVRAFDRLLLTKKNWHSHEFFFVVVASDFLFARDS